MTRVSILHRLHQWLLVCGIAVLAAPPLLTMSARSSVARNRAWAATMDRTLDSLSAVRDTTTNVERLSSLDEALTVTRRGLASAEYHLARSRTMLDGLWRWNGRGPLLLVVGCLFLMIGVRLRRFERYGV